MAFSHTNKYEHFHQKKWYYFLKGGAKSGAPALLTENSQDQVKKGMIVHLTRGTTRLFALFENPHQFLQYETGIDIPNRCFYETVFGQDPQKPHFDIDISINEKFISEIGQAIDQMLTELVSAIISIMRKVGITIDMSRDLLIFTSHGEKKRSFHIVVDHYFHSDHKEAKAFYQLVISKVSPAYRNWIDGMVYSSLQQFRLEGSQKAGSGRIKTLQETWRWNKSVIRYQFSKTPINLFHKRILIFNASLLSHFQNGQILPSFIALLPQKSNLLTSKNLDPNQTLTDQEGIMALKMIASLAGASITDPRFPYQFIKVEGGLVVLKRLHPSKCRICDRIHENENPYLVIAGREKNVYFNCRRNEENRCLFVGKLYPSGDGNPDLDNTTNSGPSMEELMTLPISVPTVDTDGKILVKNSSQHNNPLPNSDSNPGQLQASSKSSDVVIIPKIKSITVIRAIYPRQTSSGTVNLDKFNNHPSVSSAMFLQLQKMSKGMPYKTKSGRKRGGGKCLREYHPPIEILKDLKF